MADDKIDYTLERQKDREQGRKVYEESGKRTKRYYAKQASLIGSKLTQKEIEAYRDVRKY